MKTSFADVLGASLRWGLVIASFLPAPRSLGAEARWPQFLGPAGHAVADADHPPVTFGPESNLVWRAELPGGASSPCLWGDRIFLTTFHDGRLETLCVRRRDGEVLWRQS